MTMGDSSCSGLFTAALHFKQLIRGPFHLVQAALTIASSASDNIGT